MLELLILLVITYGTSVMITRVLLPTEEKK